MAYPVPPDWRRYCPLRSTGFDIISLLHRLSPVTFVTQDQDFFKHRLCHSRYCLAWLDVTPGEAAFYVRAFLRYPAFHTTAKRMGAVARITDRGIQYWTHLHRGMISAAWQR